MCERVHFRGRFVITTERDGNTLLYSVATKTGFVLASGYEMVNGDEGEAVWRMEQKAESFYDSFARKRGKYR